MRPFVFLGVFVFTYIFYVVFVFCMCIWCNGDGTSVAV